MPRQNDWATAAATEIYKDCLDRRGIKWEFEKVDSRIKHDEILPVWAQIIRKASRVVPETRKAKRECKG